MKKIIYSLATVALFMFVASCQDDNEGGVKNPVKAGDEIGFATSLPENVKTKVVYGEPDVSNREFPVYWENGDEIVIFCPQSSNTQLAHYTIGVSGSKQNVAESVTRIGDVGLQWSGKPEDDLHKFYGFYPAKYVLGTETTGLFKMNVPVNQTVKKFTQGTDGNWKSDANTDYAIMYAYRGQKKSNTPIGKNIDLHFTPLATILEIVVQGPEEDNISDMVLTNINVRTLDGTPIVGDFTAQVIPGDNENESSEGSVVCEVNMSGKVDNNLSIPCSWQEGGETKFVTLGKGQTLNVKAFLIPTTDKVLDSKNLLVSVSTTKGTLRKTLVDAGGNSFEILPHKVNRVTLPKLKTDFENAYWINSLDPNIYLTELSIPGSKMTAETAANGASMPYQSTTIEKQFKDGVRAFILQTKKSGENIIVSRINKELTTVLSEINSYLVEAKGNGKRDFAFTLITYDTGGDGSERDWMDALQKTINNVSPDIIYKEEITPNTTIGDVDGKIIVKCNYNSESMIAGGGTAPMLYTLWDKAYVEDGLDMPWGNPHNPAKLRWLYQEVTHVTHPNNNTCSARDDYHYNAEASDADKRSYIEALFNKSLEAYKNNDHRTWFMNDLGGNYSWCDKEYFHIWDNNHNVKSENISFTMNMNQLGIDILQKRTENAGLGLIFMNFANRNEDTGVKYKSDLLLQTIIDNNFKFALRKKGSTTTYDASYTSGGNVIE